MQKSKDYSNPREEETESKFPEIVKNIALIYKELGQNDKALAAIEAARSSNPGDVGLIITCLLYTSQSPRGQRGSRLPSCA